MCRRVSSNEHVNGHTVRTLQESRETASSIFKEIVGKDSGCRFDTFRSAHEKFYDSALDLKTPVGKVRGTYYVKPRAEAGPSPGPGSPSAKRDPPPAGANSAAPSGMRHPSPVGSFQLPVLTISLLLQGTSGRSGSAALQVEQAFQKALKEQQR